MTPPDPECTVGNRKNTGCDQEAVGRKIGPGFTDKVTVRTGFAIRRSSHMIAGIGKLPFFSRYLRSRPGFSRVQGLPCRQSTAAARVQARTRKYRRPWGEESTASIAAMTSRGQAEFCRADIDADHVAILKKIKSLAAHAQTRIALLGNGEGHRIRTQYRRDQPLGRSASACPGEVESGSPTRTCANTRIYSASRSYWVTE
jgi:hypothetical protein